MNSNMSRIIFIISQKGGVGKSNICSNLSHLLSNEPYNKKVLLISTDAQCDLDEHCGYSAKYKLDNEIPTIYDVFTSKSKLVDAIIKTEYGHDMILSDKRLAMADRNFVDADDFFIIKDMVSHLQEYDYIIFDSNRARGFISTAIFYACDYVIIPALNDSGSITAITEIHNDIRRLRDRGLSNARILGVLMSKYENTNEHKETNELLDMVAETYGCVKFSPIRKSIAVDRSRKHHKPLNLYKRWDNASVDFRRLAKEIVERIDEIEGVK